jgi:hypothetical protein
MIPRWLAIGGKLIAVLVFSLILNLPIFFYKNGVTNLLSFSLFVALPFIGIAVLEPLRAAGRFQNFFAHRSFNGMLLRAFMIYVPTFVANVFVPEPVTLYVSSFQVGMLVGLLTGAPFATLENPQTSNKRYWANFGLFLGICIGFAIFLASGHSIASLIKGLGVAISFPVLLWLGLIFGHFVNQCIDALRSTFQILKRLSKTIIAFASGYLAIVIIFATLFAATWRLEGTQSFKGFPANPPMTTFVYYSLVTATTVGYGDIVPESEAARTLTGLESIISLIWTLIVFAAVAVRFAEAIKVEPARHDHK